MSIENWLSLASLIVIIFGFTVTILQWRNSSKIKRAEFVFQIMEKLRFDDVASTALAIDYSHKWYDDNFHDNDNESSKSITEKKIDKLFNILDYICYLYDLRLLSKREFMQMEYKIKRV